MNKLFIIGNGFDLAHGLKTRYSDFLLEYLRKALKELPTKKSHNDKLMNLSYRPDLPIEIDSIKDFKDLTNRNEGSIRAQYTYPFFQNIIDKHLDSNWVDIENYYFKVLLNFYGFVEEKILNPDYTMDPEVKKLNDCLDNIKEELITYLKGIEVTEEHKKKTINQCFAWEVSETKSKNGDSGNRYQILFLIFNYTSTIDLYKDMLPSDICKCIYIHGNINDIDNNPIIFGYGDESDIYYEKMERINSNEFIRNIKSSHYCKTHNYQQLSNFIDKELFDVSIMGHSCGLSDRVLLKSIFEHENCHSIRIYYHKRSDSDNDYFEKTLQLSRHFRAELKDKMRRIIIPFPSCTPLT